MRGRFDTEFPIILSPGWYCWYLYCGAVVERCQLLGNRRVHVQLPWPLWGDGCNGQPRWGYSQGLPVSNSRLPDVAYCGRYWFLHRVVMIKMRTPRSPLLATLIPFGVAVFVDSSFSRSPRSRYYPPMEIVQFR